MAEPASGGSRLKVLVTVGMGPYPFDRLIGALDPVGARHEVFAQIGTASLSPSCPHERFVTYGVLRELIEWADVVVTHAGNTVRVIQSMGKVPIAVARLARWGEMANDHQATYLARERQTGRVVTVDDVGDLLEVVERHPDAERWMLQHRSGPAVADPSAVGRFLDEVIAPVVARGRARRKATRASKWRTPS